MQKRKKQKNIPLKVLKIILFILLSYAAVRIGMMGGNMMDRLDLKMIEKVNPESFKLTLNNSIPLIDTVYNSGNVNTSFIVEFSNLIGRIFNFDINNPLTILNAQSSQFYCFYYKDYQKILAEKEKSKSIDDENRIADKDGPAVVTPIPEKVTPIPELTTPNPEKNTPEPEKQENTPNPKEPIGESAYFEGDEKDPQSEQIVADTSIKVKKENTVKLSSNTVNQLITQLLNQPLKFKMTKKSTEILVYHTHTSEAYLKNASEIGKKGISSHTSNPLYSVVRVGDELANTLEKKYGYKVMHNGTVHDSDYPSSYSKSLKTAESILKGNPSIKVMIDLHRNGLDGVNKLRAVGKVNNKNAAKIMFVVGTNSRFKNDVWKENFKLALKMQKKLMEIDPDLVEPISLREMRFNQHLRNGSMLIEVGGDGNTVAECLESVKHLAKALNDVLSGK